MPPLTTMLDTIYYAFAFENSCSKLGELQRVECVPKATCDLYMKCIDSDDLLRISEITVNH